MAEISRKSGRRTLEWINTRKSSKSEVYDFYKRFRSQLKGRGIKIPLLSPTTKKSDIVSTLISFEQAERETALEREYNRLVRTALKNSPDKFANDMRKYENRIKNLHKRGLIDINTFMGGSLLTSNDESIASSESTSEHKGRAIKDLYAQFVDEGLLEPETYEISDKIYTDMLAVQRNKDKLNMYERIYKGTAKKGSSEYWDGFKDFVKELQVVQNSLADVQNENIPAFDTTAYDDLFLNLRNSFSKK